MAERSTVLVVGIGNPYRSDDAVGLHVGAGCQGVYRRPQRLLNVLARQPN